MNNNKKVIQSLIVDDDIEFAKSVNVFLEDIGINSFLISDSTEVTKYLRKNNVDVLLLDLMMPRLNGIDIIKEIRKSENYLPIIVISATGNINLAVDALKQGADDFISKPIINFEQLEISIRRVLDKVLLLNEITEYRKNLESLVGLRTKQLELKNKDLEELNKNLGAEIKKRMEAEEIVKKGVLNIITALEDERKRLAKELHDSIGQKLMFSKLNLEMVQKAESGNNEMLNSAVDYLNQIGNDIYSLIRSLYPPAIEKYSLKKNIESLIGNFEKVISAKIDFNCEGDEVRLEKEVKLNLYRVYQEALNNISKHSTSKEISVTLKFSTGKISGRIENDGIINNHKQVSNGIGIFTMKERIHKLNGSLNVDTSDPGVFIVTFEIPVWKK